MKILCIQLIFLSAKFSLYRRQKIVEYIFKRNDFFFDAIQEANSNLKLDLNPAQRSTANIWKHFGKKNSKSNKTKTSSSELHSETDVFEIIGFLYVAQYSMPFAGKNHILKCNGRETKWIFRTDTDLKYFCKLLLNGFRLTIAHNRDE